jgi:HK97 family phage prohead protease
MENKQEIQFKGIARAIEYKEDADKGILHIKAYALAFDNVDSYGDIIAPTACDEFLKSENASRIKLCYQHDRNEVIGVITDKGTDAIGMWIEADILPTTTGKDVQTLLKAGAINEFSIGYWADEYHYEKREGYQYDVRVLDAITVIEVSPVTRAANPKAVITDMKKEQENKPLNTEKMEDIKKQLEEIKHEATAAKEQMVAKEQELKTAQENINNIDASVKAQQAVIESMQK